MLALAYLCSVVPGCDYGRPEQWWGAAGLQGFAQQDAEECWTQIMQALRSSVKVRG